jgi:hypothetical protein
MLQCRLFYKLSFNSSLCLNKLLTERFLEQSVVYALIIGYLK